MRASIIGLRVVNIYDIDTKVSLKSHFCVSDRKPHLQFTDLSFQVGISRQREGMECIIQRKAKLTMVSFPVQVVLLLESGIRFHSTSYARDKSDMPSVFAMKLRKSLRTKRLDDVRQVTTCWNHMLVSFPPDYLLLAHTVRNRSCG